MSDEEVDHEEEEEEEEEEEDENDEELEKERLAAEAKLAALKLAAEKQKQKLAEDKLKAEQQKAKRSTFLSNQTEFSTNFASKQEEEEAKQRQIKLQNEELLTQQMKVASAGYVAPKQNSVYTADVVELDRIVIEPLPEIIPAPAPAKAVVKQAEPTLEPTNTNKSVIGNRLIGGNTSKIQKHDDRFASLLTDEVPVPQSPTFKVHDEADEISEDNLFNLKSKSSGVKAGAAAGNDRTDSPIIAPAPAVVSKPPVARISPLTVPTPAAAPIPKPTPTPAAAAPAPTVANNAPEEFRAPTRIAALNNPKKDKNKASTSTASAVASGGNNTSSMVANPIVPVVTTKVVTPPTHPNTNTSSSSSSSSSSSATKTGTPPPAPAPAAPVISAEEVEAKKEEQTRKDRAAWKAKQSDLTQKRQDFHGAVAYAYGGIFSWQMYGTADNVDETGATYTEYLMRCQWGLTWDTMKPWIAARRYKEFNYLDTQVRDFFPKYRMQLLPLPEKRIVGHLSTDVVKGRQIALELYMTRLVESMPEIVDSVYLDVFLNMKNRINNIRNGIIQEERAHVASLIDENGGSGGANGTGNEDGIPIRLSLHQAPGSSSELMGDNSAPLSHDKYTSKQYHDIIAIKVLNYTIHTAECIYNASCTTTGGGGIAAINMDDPLGGMSSSSVSSTVAAVTTSSIPNCTEDQVCDLEECIVVIRRCLKGMNNKNAAGLNIELVYNLQQCCYYWPNMKSTMCFQDTPANNSNTTSNANYILIPRVMQIEEDLIRYLNEYKSIHALYKL